MYRIRIRLPLKTKVPGRNADDSPDVRSAFRVIAGIARGTGTRLIGRALGVARTEGGYPQRAGAGDASRGVDFGWRLLGIP